MAAVPLITAYALGATLVRAFGGVVSALLPERIVRDGLLLVLVGLAAVAGLREDASLVMLAVLASSGMTVGLVFVTAAKLRPSGLRRAKTSYAAKEWWPAVPPLMSFDDNSTAIEPGVWPPVCRTIPSTPKSSRFNVSPLVIKMSGMKPS